MGFATLTDSIKAALGLAGVTDDSALDEFHPAPNRASKRAAGQRTTLRPRANLRSNHARATPHPLAIRAVDRGTPKEQEIRLAAEARLDGAFEANEALPEEQRKVWVFPFQEQARRDARNRGKRARAARAITQARG